MVTKLFFGFEPVANPHRGRSRWLLKFCSVQRWHIFELHYCLRDIDMRNRSTTDSIRHLPGEYPRRLPGDGDRFTCLRWGGAGDLLCGPGPAFGPPPPPPPLLYRRRREPGVGDRLVLELESECEVLLLLLYDELLL